MNQMVQAEAALTTSKDQVQDQEQVHGNLQLLERPKWKKKQKKQKKQPQQIQENS